MTTWLDIEALYQRHGHSVLRRARQILNSEEEANDILHDLFTSLIERPHQFDGRCSPITFLYRATTNACLSRLRNQRNRLRLLAEHVQPWSSNIDRCSTEAKSAVRGVLAQLTDDEARAAVYHYIDGMSHAEVAEVIGCSRRHVGDLLERVTRRLVRDEGRS